MALCYPIKGHTHGPLDGVGGQCTVKTSLHEFSNADQLTSIYDEFLQQSDTDPGSAYKCLLAHDS